MCIRDRCNGEENEIDHYVWGNSHTQQVEQFCKDVTSWMKVVKLTSVVENLLIVKSLRPCSHE
eukprot:6359165-Amphidinium_carterae.1